MCEGGAYLQDSRVINLLLIISYNYVDTACPPCECPTCQIPTVPTPTCPSKQIHIIAYYIIILLSH